MIVPFVLAVDFLNFTYTTNPCGATVPVPVVMRNGSFSYDDRTAGSGFELNVFSVKEGSLRDGTRQAVVILACDDLIGGIAAAYLFDERSSGPVLLARVGYAEWGNEWGRGPDSIHVTFARHFLYVDECADDDCTKYDVTTYALRAGALAKVGVETHAPRSLPTTR
jgi:hypothetical protein